MAAGFFYCFQVFVETSGWSCEIDEDSVAGGFVPLLMSNECAGCSGEISFHGKECHIEWAHLISCEFGVKYGFVEFHGSFHVYGRDFEPSNRVSLHKIVGLIGINTALG